MRTWLSQFRLAVRRLLKAPAFTLAAVATLALGIGATTAIFSVASAVLLRPLPYPEPDRLVTVGQLYTDGVAGVGEPKFLFWRQEAQSFEALGCYSQYGGASGNLSGGREAEFVNGLRVSALYFKALGVSPALGRPFSTAEDTPGGARVAILSDGLWRRSFGSDPGVVGRTVYLDDAPMTVVGIMPSGFRTGSPTDLFVPMQARANAHYDPNATVVGRLKAGVSLEAARAEMAAIAARYAQAFPRFMERGESVSVRPYRELFTDGTDQVLWTLLGAVSFLLIIACANVAHLQLSRAAARQREFAVRSALGGGGGRIAMQLAAESLVVSLAAGVCGLVLAAAATRVLVSLMPPGFLPEVTVVAFDWRVLGFALLSAILTGLAAALAPLAQTRRFDIGLALRDGGRGGTARSGLRSSLVVAELALSVALLAGALLLTRSFANLLAVAPGFDPRSVITFQVAPSGARYRDTARVAAFFDGVLDRVSGLPGVSAAAVTNKLPLDWQFNMPVVLPDRPEQFQNVQVRMVSPDFFKAMGIPVREGRDFSRQDRAGAPAVAIVNQAFASKFLPGRLPFTRRLSIGRGLDEPNRQVIAVVGDIKQSGLDREAPPMVFVPLPQVSDRLLGIFRAFTPTRVVVKIAGEGQALASALSRAVASVDPAVAVAEISSMEDLTERSTASQKFSTTLVSVFGGVALLLALVGVYGVMSYRVGQQRRELGVRMALGARAGDVARLVMRQGLRLAGAGGALGALLFAALGGVLQSMLFGVNARDPRVFLIAWLTLGLTVLLASGLPARRAAALDPMEALRRE